MDDPAPHVVIVGGYLTEPLFYIPMRARLLRRGAARVSVAQVHYPQWLGASFMGFGPALMRTARAIREARRASPHPIVVVGHSAGGLVTRLAMSPQAFEGRLASVASDVGCLVTLGTPHSLTGTIAGWDHAGLRATRFLDEHTPGAWFAPTTAYLTVGSTLVKPHAPNPTHPLKRIVNAVMGTFVGPPHEAGGDGIVSDDQSRLDGATHLALPDVLHGTFGGPWFGDGRIIDRWWPVALDLWRDALHARAESAVAESVDAAGSDPGPRPTSELASTVPRDRDDDGPTKMPQPADAMSRQP